MNKTEPKITEKLKTWMSFKKNLIEISQLKIAKTRSVQKFVTKHKNMEQNIQNWKSLVNQNSI